MLSIGQRCRENTYPPLNVLKPVWDNVWIVDGPAIEFGPPLARMKFPTRMTILRLNSKDLFIHSPTPITKALAEQIKQIGVPKWLIGPNKIHYWWIADWKREYPDAIAYLAAGITERAGTRASFFSYDLIKSGGYPWDDCVLTMPIVSNFMTEVVFFHRQSRTLIITDLIENFEAEKLSWWEWVLAKLGGILHPDGATPRDMRFTFRTHKKELRKSVDEMISWQPERIILAHGRWYEANGVHELRRAFRWVAS